MNEIKLITLDPGHFHAALVQKEMYPEVAGRVHIYAPVGADVNDHVKRIAGFNTRKQNPTAWELEIHCGPDYLARMRKERPGNVVVLAGRSRGKIDYIQAAVEAGLNVLADKPWIIRSVDLPKLEAALDAAERSGLIAYDIMTERFEITSILQRELVNDEAAFGSIIPGTEREPAVFMESVHHLMKTVAGAPLLRPAWFFDIAQQGEALADVGTHLVDLIQWTLFPDQAIDHRQEIRLVEAQRWPTVLGQADFQRVTGESAFPEYLALKDGRLEYFCNNRIVYALRGVHVKLDVLWNYEAPAGAGDTHLAVYRGSRSRVEIRQGREQNYRPELYIVPNSPAGKAQVLAAARKKIASVEKRFPGIAVKDLGEQFLIEIPESHRVGHEAHFAQVAKQFFRYLENPGALPAWEKPNMLAKYFVASKGTELSHAKS